MADGACGGGSDSVHQAGATHYELLGVPRDAPPEAVRAAYQRLLLSVHPDKAGPEGHGRFQRLQEAWEALREPRGRALYDHQLTQAELRAAVLLHEEVDLGDMGWAAEQEEWGEHEEEQQQEDQQQEEQEEQEEGGPAGGKAPPGQPGPAARTYPCRCGDSYVLRARDQQLAAGGGEVILPCRSCSNHILVRLP